ncbi:toll/interleukin-1 receptor domain-containing protein [Fulvimonas yonginensis]|uniref:Toll/interleukin-1 receptor domain-containing protein n=1 Tax=Fulvimonas yonginensis TaxID=1495200 RepID=A0ABU8JD94_9GAMM
MNQAPHAEAFHYRAFISYSHHDKAWAEWLHRGLEAYRVPSRLVGRQTAAGQVPRRLAPVFRDRDELASSADLGGKVNQALQRAANLIVICSPASARSRWVNEEVRTFRRLGRDGRIFCLIVAGEPHAGEPSQECLPAALGEPAPDDERPGASDVEPLAADVRPGKDGKHDARLKLIAGLLDVEYDQLRRRELQRRNRRLTAIAALALLVTLVTGLLAIDATLARRAAERRQKQAEDLIGFMLGDLNDKLAQVQRLDVMEAVDDKAIAYFRALPSTDVTDDALEQRVKALEKIGSVRLDQGRLAPAMRAFQAAMPLARRLAQAAPHDRARQIAYARIQAFAGMAEWYRGRLDAAERFFGAAQATLEHMGAPAHDDPEVLFELSSLDNDIGHVLEARGRLDAAAVHYRRMLARCRTLTGLGSPKAEWLEHLGEAHNNLGKLALMHGDLLSAIREYAADDAIETRLNDAHPDDNDQRENTARVRAILGRTLLLAGAEEQADRALTNALATVEALHRFDPSQSHFKEKVGLYSTQLGRLRRLQGQPAAAGTLLTRAVVVLEGLTRQDPAHTGWRQDLAEARTERATLLQADGHAGAARADAQAAASALASLLGDQPDERGLLLSYARATLQFADLQPETVAGRLRRDVLQRLDDTHGATGDVRLLALRIETLLALGRAADTRPSVQQLWQAGYREPSLVRRLKAARIPYPPNPAFEQRLHSVLGEGAWAEAR